MAATGAALIILASRSGYITKGDVHKESVSHLTRSRPSTVQVWVQAVDVGSADEAVHSIRSALQLTGMLHAASVLRDALLRTSSIEAFNEVLKPKACAAAHLSRMLACSVLEAATCFSSTASTFGNVGQTNYAAASAYLDAFALSQRLHGTVGCALQLPPITDVGMGAATFNAKQMSTMGALSLSEYARSMLRVHWGCYMRALESVRTPLLKSFISRLSSRNAMHVLLELRDGHQIDANAQTRAQHGTLLTSLPALKASQRQISIESAVMRLVSEVTSTSVGLHQPFMEASVDSNAATELSTNLACRTGLVLSSTAIFEHPTPREIASHILKQMGYADVKIWTSCAVLTNTVMIEQRTPQFPQAPQRWPHTWQRARSPTPRSCRHQQA